MSIKFFSRKILFSALFLMSSLQISAQSNCSNLDNKVFSNTGKNHVFSNHSFGQTFEADPSCMGGSTLKSFSFWCQGNSSTKFSVAVYPGEVIPSTPGAGSIIYEKDLERAPTNHKGIIKVDFQNPASLTAGQKYTVAVHMNGGNMVAHTSPAASGVDGKVFFRKSASDSQFYPDSDLKYELGFGDAVCSTISNTSKNMGQNHVFNQHSFGQSFKASSSCLPGNKMSSFTFWAQGNSPTKIQMSVYKGKVNPETSSASPLVTTAVIDKAPGNGPAKVDLPSPLTLTAGDTYTVIITMKGGNLIAQTTDNAVTGQAYFRKSSSNAKFYSGSDLKFELK